MDYKDAPNDLAPRNKSNTDDWYRAYIAQLEYALAKSETDNERLRTKLQEILDIADSECDSESDQLNGIFCVVVAALAEQEKADG